MKYCLQHSKWSVAGETWILYRIDILGNGKKSYSMMQLGGTMKSVFRWTPEVTMLEIDRGVGCEVMTITTEDEWAIEVLKG